MVPTILESAECPLGAPRGTAAADGMRDRQVVRFAATQVTRRPLPLSADLQPRVIDQS
jgi:hypothetical protein